MKDSYNKSSIKNQSIRDHIIEVPGLYVGTIWNEDGLHRLVSEIMRLAILPETLNNCSSLLVSIEEPQKLVIQDDGVGLDVETIQIGKIHQIPRIEHVLTWYMPRYPDENYYRTFGFLDYSGTVLSMVSELLEIETVKTGYLYKVASSRGEIVTPVTQVMKTDKTGTRITIIPDNIVFGDVQFSPETINKNLTGFAEKYSHVQFKFEDKLL